MAPKLLVTGSSSLVGSHFVENTCLRFEISVIGRTNFFRGTDALAKFTKLDLTNGEKLESAVKSSDAEYVINFAAETSVDGCEVERNRTSGRVYLTNTRAVRVLADVCKRTGKTLYQISTDAVFDGTYGPYSEVARPGPLHLPLSWYGQTKYLAEREVAALLSDFCIVRISYPYRSHFKSKTDFARNILRLYASGKLFPLFDDQIISPTLVDDISSATEFLIERGAHGIFHVASRNITTPYEFAGYLISTFFSVKDPDTVLKKESVAKHGSASGRAPRPIRGGLKTAKIMSLGFTPRTFQEGIQEIFRQSASQDGQGLVGEEARVSQRV